MTPRQTMILSLFLSALLAGPLLAQPVENTETSTTKQTADAKDSLSKELQIEVGIPEETANKMIDLLLNQTKLFSVARHDLYKAKRALIDYAIFTTEPNESSATALLNNYTSAIMKVSAKSMEGDYLLELLKLTSAPNVISFIRRSKQHRHLLYTPPLQQPETPTDREKLPPPTKKIGETAQILRIAGSITPKAAKEIEELLNDRDEAALTTAEKQAKSGKDIEDAELAGIADEKQATELIQAVMDWNSETGRNKSEHIKKLMDITTADATIRLVYLELSQEETGPSIKDMPKKRECTGPNCAPNMNGAPSHSSGRCGLWSFFGLPAQVLMMLGRVVAPDCGPTNMMAMPPRPGPDGMMPGPGGMMPGPKGMRPDPRDMRPGPKGMRPGPRDMRPRHKPGLSPNHGDDTGS